jgi:hypothetical protein
VCEQIVGTMLPPLTYNEKATVSLSWESGNRGQLR